LLEGSKRTSRDVRGPAAGRADALDEAHCPTHVRASKLQRFGLLRGSGGCGKTSCAGFKVFSKIAPDSNEIGVSCAGFTVFFEIALDSNQKKCLRRIPILLRCFPSMPEVEEGCVVHGERGPHRGDSSRRAPRSAVGVCTLACMCASVRDCHRVRPLLHIDGGVLRQ
jgi:hypothetical protein